MSGDSRFLDTSFGIGVVIDGDAVCTPCTSVFAVPERGAICDGLKISPDILNSTVNVVGAHYPGTAHSTNTDAVAVRASVFHQNTANTTCRDTVGNCGVEKCALQSLFIE